ncbi:MAG TPA: hypothetical protein VGZ90_12895 [Puia sp.]|jgi:hypothetical protein|nr:hypothetical protein [Puia sp.]
MKKELISNRLFCILSGISGIAGVLMLIVSFNINPGPPPGATDEQLISFGHQYYSSILWGAWLQAVGPFFIVLFAIALITQAGAARQFSGMLTLFGAGTLMTVSLIEITFYIAVLFKDPPLSHLIGLNLIYSVQHLYFIIAAPALFIPLGFVILCSDLIHRLFGWTAIGIGLSFALLGILFLFQLALPMLVTAFAGIQVFWWLSASISLMMRSGK